MLAGGKEPPYWRAVAANLLWRWAGEPEVKAALLARLKDEHPLAREKAVRALESQVEAGDSGTTAALKPMLEDPAHCVRVAAAWALRATVDPQSRAGRELAHALSLNADQPDGQFRLAMFRLARQQPAEALAHLQKAVAWDPLSPPFRCMLAVVLNQMGKTVEALETLAQAEKLSPNDPQIPYARATILVRAGRMQEARAAANRALQVQQDFQPATELLQQLGAAPR
jgi:Flp pilus assembly protein TadD